MSTSSRYIINSGCEMVAKGLRYVKEIFERHEGTFRNWIFLMMCVISISLDPLFFFIPVINDHKSCLDLDKKLGVTACVLRSVIDFLYVIYISFQLRTDSSASRDKPNGELQTDFSASRDKPNGEGSGYSLRKRDCAIVWKLRPYHIIDLLAILPLQQVVIIIIIVATKRGSKLLNAINLLKYFVFFQYVPRVIRIYPLFRKATRTLGIFAETAWSKAAFYFLLYVVAGHVFGALWYILAIEREIECWKNVCKSHARCPRDSIDCHKSSENRVFFNDFCSAETHNTKIYDFGIFRDAVQSGIVGNRNFLKKFMYCFRWGLQSLSCFGQNLVTSTDVWENIFTISITVSSVLMFIFLIGNMQIYLQVETIRSEEMKSKLRDIGRWTHYKKLPESLQEEVKRCQQHVWRETKGVDVENLLNSLPRDLRRDIMLSLCEHMLKTVPIFEIMDKQSFNDMCDRLKPVLHRHGSYIIRKGDTIDGMLFITGGMVWSKTNNDSIHRVQVKFCGEELALWALDPRSSSKPPVSVRYVEACTDVEGFALMADDVKYVVSLFAQNHNNKEQLCHVIKKTWAAFALTVALHRYSENQHKKSPSSSISKTYADTVIHAIRLNVLLKMPILRRGNHIYPRKPVEQVKISSDL